VQDHWFSCTFKSLVSSPLISISHPTTYQGVATVRPSSSSCWECNYLSYLPMYLVYYLLTCLSSLPTHLPMLSTYEPFYPPCHDLNFGLVTKAKAWKGVGRQCNLGVTFTLLEVQKNVKEWAHTFPSGLPLWELESQIFRKQFERSKLIRLRIFLYHYKDLKT
jgi:hypothetical protein